MVSNITTSQQTEQFRQISEERKKWLLSDFGSTSTEKLLNDLGKENLQLPTFETATIEKLKNKYPQIAGISDGQIELWPLIATIAQEKDKYLQRLLNENPDPTKLRREPGSDPINGYRILTDNLVERYQSMRLLDLLTIKADPHVEAEHEGALSCVLRDKITKNELIELSINNENDRGLSEHQKNEFIRLLLPLIKASKNENLCLIFENVGFSDEQKALIIGAGSEIKNFNAYFDSFLDDL